MIKVRGLTGAHRRCKPQQGEYECIQGKNPCWKVGGCLGLSPRGMVGGTGPLQFQVGGSVSLVLPRIDALGIILPPKIIFDFQLSETHSPAFWELDLHSRTIYIFSKLKTSTTVHPLRVLQRNKNF